MNMDNIRAGDIERFTKGSEITINTPLQLVNLWWMTGWPTLRPTSTGLTTKK